MRCADCCLRTLYTCPASDTGQKGLVKHGIDHDCHDNEARVDLLRKQLGQIEDKSARWLSVWPKIYYSEVAD